MFPRIAAAKIALNQREKLVAVKRTAEVPTAYGSFGKERCRVKGSEEKCSLAKLLFVSSRFQSLQGYGS